MAKRKVHRMFTKKAKRLKKLLKQNKITWDEFIMISSQDNQLIKNEAGGF
tara:strand:+ start:507 stop:656 length:150 start_codon:yes stop_codon:yes gene_type:complete